LTVWFKVRFFWDFGSETDREENCLDEESGELECNVVFTYKLIEPGPGEIRESTGFADIALG